MATQTAAGARLYIGGTGALNSESSWVEVAEVVNLGEFGKTYAEVLHNPLGTRETVKHKGSFNLGNLEMQLGRDVSDEGQDDLLAALDDDADYNFKIELDDAPGGSDATPTTWKFKAKVMSFREVIDTVDTIVGARCTLGIVGTSITFDPPSAGT